MEHSQLLPPAGWAPLRCGQALVGARLPHPRKRATGRKTSSSPARQVRFAGRSGCCRRWRVDQHDGTAAAAQAPSATPSGPSTKAPRAGNATDCHFHIYDNRYPPAPGGLPAPDASARPIIARCRPATAPPAVSSSSPRFTASTTAQRSKAWPRLVPNFRAVAVVNTGITDAELQRMHGLGVRGIRFNLAQAGATWLEMLEPLSQRVDALGWHCRINMPGDRIVAASDTFLRIRGKPPVDHLAHCPQPAGVDSDTFKLIRRLLDKGNTWVKLSGAYADTKVGPPSYSDSSAVARAFAIAAPTRMVWGSDWPHPTEKLDNKPDDARAVRPARGLGAGRGARASACWWTIPPNSTTSRKPDASRRGDRCVSNNNVFTNADIFTAHVKVLEATTIVNCGAAS